MYGLSDPGAYRFGSDRSLPDAQGGILLNIA